MAARIMAASPAAARAADRLTIAPMLDWTTRHYRYLMRLMTRRTRLYTEMVVDQTLAHSPLAHSFLRFHPSEHPVACQLGGSTPSLLSAAAAMAAEMGYDEVNLNCGCPSPRVAGKGGFGASLMFTPEVVRDCVAAMVAAVAPYGIPVTVKCRLGADTMDSYEAFANFIGVVASGGCSHFIVHARKCVLKGLSPKDNRMIPPLRYHWVQRIAIDFPHLRFSINGGVATLPQATRLLSLRSALPAPWRAAVGSSPAGDAGAGAIAAAVTAPGGTESAHDGGSDGRPAAAGCGECGCDEAAETDGGAPATATAAPARRLSRAASGDGTDMLPDGYPKDPHEQLLPGVTVHDFDPATTFAADDADGGRRLLDSVMIGRAAYADPWMFADVDRTIFGVENPGLSRRQVLAAYLDYSDEVIASLPEEERRLSLYHVQEFAKPLLNLFCSMPRGRAFRQHLSENVGLHRMPLRDAVTAAMALVPPLVLDAKPGEVVDIKALAGELEAETRRERGGGARRGSHDLSGGAASAGATATAAVLGSGASEAAAAASGGAVVAHGDGERLSSA